MGSRYLTDLADVLRAAGLVVDEEPGWQTRARGSGGFDGDRPWVVMWHHTASDTTPDNDVGYIVNSEDAPLANLYLARDGTVTVCAAGATNTNGKGNAVGVSRGVVPADSMNTHAIGIEAANDGLGQSWPQEQIDAYFTVNNALCAAYGLLPTDCLTHQGYAPDRKIDPATGDAVQGPWHPDVVNSSGTWSIESIRSEAVARSNPTPPSPPKESDLVFTIANIVGTGVALGGNMDKNGIIAQVTWLSPGRFDACLSAGAPIIDLSPNDLVNCDLLGPLPDNFEPHWFANVVT